MFPPLAFPKVTMTSHYNDGKSWTFIYFVNTIWQITNPIDHGSWDHPGLYTKSLCGNNEVKDMYTMCNIVSISHKIGERFFSGFFGCGYIIFFGEYKWFINHVIQVCFNNIVVIIARQEKWPLGIWIKKANRKPQQSTRKREMCLVTCHCVANKVLLTKRV